MSDERVESGGVVVLRVLNLVKRLSDFDDGGVEIFGLEGLEGALGDARHGVGLLDELLLRREAAELFCDVVLRSETTDLLVEVFLCDLGHVCYKLLIQNGFNPKRSIAGKAVKGSRSALCGPGALFLFLLSGAEALGPRRPGLLAVAVRLENPLPDRLLDAGEFGCKNLLALRVGDVVGAELVLGPGVADGFDELPFGPLVEQPHVVLLFFRHGDDAFLQRLVLRREPRWLAHRAPAVRGRTPGASP